MTHPQRIVAAATAWCRTVPVATCDWRTAAVPTGNEAQTQEFPFAKDTYVNISQPSIIPDEHFMCMQMVESMLWARVIDDPFSTSAIPYCSWEHLETFLSKAIVYAVGIVCTLSRPLSLVRHVNDAF